MPIRWQAITWTNVDQDLCCHMASLGHNGLTHWGWVTPIYVNKLTIIGSDNGLASGRRQALIWTNVGILLIGPLGTNFSEILIKIHTFSFKKMRLKMLSVKRRPFCLGLSVLIHAASNPGWPCGFDIPGCVYWAGHSGQWSNDNYYTKSMPAHLPNTGENCFWGK